jgi:hypothetical protein
MIMMTGQALRRRINALMQIASELHDTQSRAATLAITAGGEPMRATAPDTFGEFLMRTSGRLRHEPPASARLRRRPG